MNFNMITAAELTNFKKELLAELNGRPKNSHYRTHFRTKEVLEYLSISASSLQNMRINGDIPFSKIGGTLFYKIDDINDILEKNSKN